LLCAPGSDFYVEEKDGNVEVLRNVLKHREGPATPDVPWIGGTRYDSERLISAITIVFNASF
jgi:hypothetical protein